MNYPLSGTGALDFTATFLSFYFTTISLYFTSLHFISLRFSSHFMMFTTPSLHLIYHFPNLFFLNLLGLQERVPKASAGNWFQSCMVLFTKGIFSDIGPSFSAYIFLS
jgi:hypothetical protein